MLRQAGIRCSARTMHDHKDSQPIEAQSRCWDYLDCPKSVREECVVFKCKAENCWDYDDNRCSEFIGYLISCKQCRFYRAKKIEKSD